MENVDNHNENDVDDKQKNNIVENDNDNNDNNNQKDDNADNDDEDEDDNEDDDDDDEEEEEEEEAGVIPLAPNHDDVVCARKKWPYNHPGNLFYTHLLKAKIHDYIMASSSSNNNKSKDNKKKNTLTKPDLNAITDSILKEIMENRQGRFLRPTDDTEAFCVVLSRSDVVSKVNMALRKQYSIFKSAPAAYSNSKKKVTTTTSQHDDDDDDDDDDDYVKAKKKRRKTTTGHGDIVKTNKKKRNTEVWSGRRDNNHHHHHHNNNNSNDGFYGSPQQELEMRRWLNENRLPQSVGDVLLSHGARNIDDVILLVESKPNLLKNLAVLDALKLRRAVQGNPV